MAAVSPAAIQHDKEAKVAYRRAHEQWIREYKATHPCIDCGESDPIVLEFDHLPQYHKARRVGSIAHLSLATIQAEIDKCEMVCANCHSRREYQRRLQ